MTINYNKVIEFMFSDTHFHFKLMAEESGHNAVEVLNTMADRNCFFGLDIGTQKDDLLFRQNYIEKRITELQSVNEINAEKAGNFVYFSAGIWPNIEDIHDWENSMKVLEESILVAEEASKNPEKCTFIKNRKIVAIGEGGIDHHWNPSGVDGRCESDFDEKTYRGEKSLFQAQLELARKMSLPIIVHSRDGFEDTLDCIKNVGYDNGIIHCYSYGIEEARAFLDRGWYISFSGGVTYTKKSKMEQMKELLQFVPEDRILCETDAPYLAPVPHRGTPNCPIYVEHTYDFVAQMRGITSEELSDIVDRNIKKLFRI